MALNCKPDQLAQIRVPDTRANVALGLTTLNGHVVKTQRLHPDMPADSPSWIVDPPQACVVRGPIPPNVGLAAGEILHCAGIPDAYLRPWRDFPPEELQVRSEELSS